MEIRMVRYCKFLLCPYMARLLPGGTQPRNTPACGQTSARILLGRKKIKIKRWKDGSVVRGYWNQ